MAKATGPSLQLEEKAMKKTIFSVFTRSIICVLTVLAPAKAQDFLDDQHVSARVSGRFDHADFQLNVMEADYGPAKDAQATHLALSQKKVVIKCWKGCDAAPDYVEDYEYIPIAAFRFGDLLPQFIVIGASASAYHVDIYQLSRKEIHKVLDQPTKAIPQFIFTKKRPPRTDSVRYGLEDECTR